MIWAYHSLDPSSDNSLGSLRHEKMGSVSLNLLGGNNEDRIEPNSDFFILGNDNVSFNYILECTNSITIHAAGDSKQRYNILVFSSISP